MKHLRKVMALAVATVMALGIVVVPAKAAPPTTGSITVSSPVVGATYNIYKIFDMTTNEAVDAFAYSIKSDNDFYGGVVAYASDADNGLILTKLPDSADSKPDDPAEYNVTIDKNKFNAQNFGVAMQGVVTNGAPPVVADEDKGIVAKDAVDADDIDAAADPIRCTTDPQTSDKIVFTALPLGYYLVNPTYPAASYESVTVTLGEITDPNSQQFGFRDLKKDGEAVQDPLELTADAKDKITAYVNATVTDEYVDDYIAKHGITNKDGSPLTPEQKQDMKDDLIVSMKDDSEAKVLAAFKNNIDGQESDINVKEPVLVFLDSSQPDAVIFEKNETDKWDVPVNPEGDALPDTPDHGEPNGGKNIVVQEATGTTPAYYGDWSEASIGDSVHYQLRINAMNFIRTGDIDATIEQVKEYIVADYQSGHMHFDESHKLQVSIWQGDNNNDSQNQKDAVNVTKNPDGTAAADGYLNYTDKATTFFKNTTDEDAASKPENIFGDGTGIVIPWVIVSDANPEKPDPAFPIYTVTKVPTGEYETADLPDGANPDDYDHEGLPDGKYYPHDKNDKRIPTYDTYYVYSLYNSDVTIVVDYWMILDDDAIVDEPGNKNYSQYGWSPVDNKDGEGNPQPPTPPSDDDKPSKREEVDEATVYTYALAWVKIDDEAEELADAEFTLPFYVKKAKDKDAYVYAFDVLPEVFPEGDSADNYTNVVTTTKESAVITIKGVKQDVYDITESKAPAGYNRLAQPFKVEAKKSGNGVKTVTKTTVYLDENGKVTDEVTERTVEYVTDTDSYSSVKEGDETIYRVPVYQFNPVVNVKGTELPDTGGIGTALFYIFGGLLVLGAGIVLVSRNRKVSQ